MKRKISSVFDPRVALAITMEARHLPGRGEKAASNRNAEAERQEPSAELDAAKLEISRLTPEALKLHLDFFMNLGELEAHGWLYQKDVDARDGADKGEPPPRLTEAQVIERGSLASMK